MFTRKLPLRTPLVIVALALGVLTPSASSADEVIAWNQIMVSAFTATNTSPQNAARIAAITQAAVFDAVNGIDRRYTPYFVTEPGPRGASRRAAAVQAAYVVLKTLLSAQAPGLGRQRDASIEAIRASQPDGAVDRGIEWGESVANALLAERSTDGFPDGGTPDTGDLTVGKWRPETPGTPAVTPWLAVMTPFAMATPDHFRPDGPPALESSAYTSDFNEVKSIGRDIGSSRTARSDGHRLLLDGQYHLPLEPDRRHHCAQAPHHPVAERADLRAAEHRDGRCGHRDLGREVLLPIVAAVQCHSAGRYRRQSRRPRPIRPGNPCS